MKEKPSLMRVRTNDQEILWQPDTGTQKNVSDKTHIHSFKKKTQETVSCRQQISSCFRIRVKTSLSVIGLFDAVLTARDRTINTKIYVTS